MQVFESGRFREKLYLEGRAQVGEDCQLPSLGTTLNGQRADSQCPAVSCNLTVKGEHSRDTIPGNGVFGLSFSALGLRVLLTQSLECQRLRNSTTQKVHLEANLFSAMKELSR